MDLDALLDSTESSSNARNERQQSGSGRRPLTGSRPSAAIQPPPLPSSNAPSGSFTIPRKSRPTDNNEEKRELPHAYNKRSNETQNDGHNGPTPKRGAYGSGSGTSMFAQAEGGTFRAVDHMPVQLNMFSVDLSRAPDRYERHHVDVSMATPKKSVVVNGETVVRGDSNGTYRRSGLWNAWKAVVHLRPELFGLTNPSTTDGHCFAAYDCAAALYMPEGQYKGGLVEEVTFGKSDVEDTKFWKPIAKILRAEAVSVTFRILRNTGGRSDGVIHTRGELAMARENRSELVRCLEILTSQETSSRLFYTFGNSTFTRDSDGSFQGSKFVPDMRMRIDSEGKEIRTGFEKTMRIVGNGKDLNVVMVIDVRRSPFYQKMSVLKFLALFYQLGPRGGGGGGRGGYGRDQSRGGYDRDQSRGSGYGRDQSRGGGYGRDQSRGGYYDRDQSRGGYGRDNRGGGYERDERGDYGREDRSRGRDDRSGNQDDGESVDSNTVKKIQEIMQRDGEKRTNSKLDELKAVTVEVTHFDSEKQTQFYIHSFDFRGANKTYFMRRSKDGEEKECSVAEYFLEQYNIRLKYPELPLAVCKRSKMFSYVPLELLVIDRGQRVKQHHISPAVQQEMTGKLSLLPAAHVSRYSRVLTEHLNVESSLFLKSFGVKILKDPFEMVARILPAPIVFFGGSQQFQPITGAGKRPTIMARSTKFVSPARIRSIRVVILDRNVDERDVEQLCDVLERSLHDNGCSIDESARRWKIVHIDASMHEELKEMLQAAKRDRITMVIGITSEKRPDVHDTLKLFESQTGQQTAHLSLQTVKQIIGRGGGAQTLANVVRKFNLKCGGLNFKTMIPKSHGKEAVCNNNSELQTKFFKDTMFVGFEMSHAGATCLFDAQNNVTCGEPTVVGVSYSKGVSTSLGGFSWQQKPREHSLQNLAKHLPKMFHDYHDDTRTLPERVVIYRTGMGEGDFETIEKEVQEMRECIEKDVHIRDISRKTYQPKFVVVVVQRNSHYRVFPQRIDDRGKSFDQNVPSGTCIDSQITCCGYDEFILVSQSALIGTIRPTRYTVLVNDEGWTKSELAHITYFSAYGHQVSYQPPGVPDVMYGAENNAKRGKNNFKAHQKLGRVEKCGRGDKNDLVEDVDGSKMEELTEKLGACTLRSHNFWA